MGRVLLVSGRAADAVEPLLQALALGGRIHDAAQGVVTGIVVESAAFLHRAYREDAEAVRAAFRASTGDDIPAWITDPPTGDRNS
jgi:hypothetical protein